MGQVVAGTIENEAEEKKKRIRQDLKFSNPAKGQEGVYGGLLK
jgi:hypothetical protein